MRTEIDNVIVHKVGKSITYNVPSAFTGTQLQDWLLKNDDEMQKLKGKTNVDKLHKDSKLINPTTSIHPIITTI